MSVPEMARVSGVSRQTLYRYFKTDGAGATSSPYSAMR
jgi:predicted DNA-binding transcriptional regulator AlpA